MHFTPSEKNRASGFPRTFVVFLDASKVEQQAGPLRPSVLCCHGQFDAVDFERQQFRHLFTELQLRLNSSRRLRMVVAVLGHPPETAVGRKQRSVDLTDNKTTLLS